MTGPQEFLSKSIVCIAHGSYPSEQQES